MKFVKRYVKIIRITMTIYREYLEKHIERTLLMPDYSKNHVLALFKILINYTDEQHQISMQDILGYMEAEGHFCSEDSILRYIKQLRNELGVDVISHLEEMPDILSETGF